jgi:hypothetical protein
MATSISSLLLFLLSEWQVEDLGILVNTEQGGTKGAFCSMMPTDEKGVSINAWLFAWPAVVYGVQYEGCMYNPITQITEQQCCESGMFMPDLGSEFFLPGSRVKKIPDPDPHQRICILTQKTVSKLVEKWSWMFIPDPGSGFFSILEPGSATLQSREHFNSSHVF